MRILYAGAETAPPTYPSVSGIFATGLGHLGHEVVGLFYDEDGPRAGDWPGEIIRVPRPRRRPVHGIATSVLNEMRAIDRALARSSPFDAVIVRDDPIMALCALRRRDRHGPVVYQISHLNAEESADHAREGLYGARALNIAKALALRALRGRAIAAADHVIVMTPEMREALGLEARRSNVVGEGVSRDWSADMSADAARAAHKVAPDVPLLVYAGTFNRVRHLETLIDAHALLRRRFPNAVLLLAGVGRESDDARFLEERAIAAGITDAVCFTGRVPHAHVAALFDAADIVVSPFPSTRVLRCNSPTRLFEAMHRGRAVVAGDIPEQRRVVEGAGCGVLAPHVPRALADAAAGLLASARLRGEMGARGRAWVLEHRTYDDLARIVDGVLHNVAARRPYR